MKRHRFRFASVAVQLGCLGIFVGASLWADQASASGSPPGSAGNGDIPPSPLGSPLPGLNQNDMQAFNQGRLEFGRIEGPPQGLGPVFNGRSCLECHGEGAPGGAGTNLGVARVTRVGGTVNGQYSDLVDFGGAVIQARSLREFIPNYPVPRENIPFQATFVSRRATTPIFGAGLIEAIPGQTLIDNANRPQPDGVTGRVNMVLNPLTGSLEVGRFGWKSQHSNLQVFAADAYLNEMGITSPLFPVENRPQGMPIPPGADQVADPEDNGTDVQAFTNFMRFLAPPAREGAMTLQIAAGEQLFSTIGCAVCHTPVLRTGNQPKAALSNKNVRLYSDLLVHDMGPQLADGVQQGQANGSEWRTAPLWGLRVRRFFLHDGRSQNIDDAIRRHGGEAQPATNRYVGLSQANRNALLAFLTRL